MTKAERIHQVALVGSYVPRLCGIGTFTKDLRDALAEEERVQTLVLAMDDRPDGYDYPDEVRFQVQANRLKDYQAAADLLNINQIDLVSLQHEFGIFGGRSGEDVLALARDLRMPILTTLHTVLAEPSAEQAAVMRELIALSDRLVVMCDKARSILQEVYEAPKSQIAVIPHGIPDLSFVDSAFYKDQFGLEGRATLLTFGLLSPGKGIELVIKALPKIVERHPETAYVILGAIHPHVYKRDGNTYLASLEHLAEQHGVSEHVIFHTRYVSLEELCGYLGATDIFVTPYPNRSQIVSGTLAYAMGAGKAVASTPYWYAEEMIGEDRGVLFPFGDADALAEAISGLLDDPVASAAMRKRAYMHCRPMVWKEVARNYLQLGKEVLREREQHPRPVFHFRVGLPEKITLPEVNPAHLRALTDDTGILQHAIYAIPDRNHGYCTDDNSRALVAAIMHMNITGDNTILPLAQTYLAFISHAYNRELGRFRNFMSYDRQWLEDEGSEDVQGRTLWSLGIAASGAADEAVRSLASRLFCEAAPGVEELGSPRAWAFSLVGIHAYLHRYSGDSMARRIREHLARRLHQAFAGNGSEDWPWCEDIVTYDNAKLPHALILSGQWLPDDKMVEQGLNSLEWLYKQQVTPEGRVSLIGNAGWMTRDGSRARFDQQPVDAMALVEACAEAYRCTRNASWFRRAQQSLQWFMGNNEVESALYDSATGGCRDGLQADGPNLNQGAESTLAWLIALLAMQQLRRETATGVPQQASAPGLAKVE